MNGFLAEVPYGPNLNHWIVEKLLQKHNRLTSKHNLETQIIHICYIFLGNGEPRRPHEETQYWLGALKFYGDWMWENRATEIQWYDWGDDQPSNDYGEVGLNQVKFLIISLLFRTA